MPRVYFESQWRKNTAVFDPILVHLGMDRIEFGLMGLFISFVWPNHGPKTIEEILDDMRIDMYLDEEQEKKFRERIALRLQKN